MNWKIQKWIWRARTIPASAVSSAGRNSGWTSQPSDQPIHLHPQNHTQTNPGLSLFHLQFRMVPMPAATPVLLSSFPGTNTDTRKNTDLGWPYSWTGFDGNEEWREWLKRRTGTLGRRSASGASSPDASWTSWEVSGRWVFLTCGWEEKVSGDGVRLCGKRVIFFWAFLRGDGERKRIFGGYAIGVAVATVRHGEEWRVEERFKVRKRWRDRSQAVKGVVGCVLQLACWGNMQN